MEAETAQYILLSMNHWWSTPSRSGPSGTHVWQNIFLIRQQCRVLDSCNLPVVFVNGHHWCNLRDQNDIWLHLILNIWRISWPISYSTRRITQKGSKLNTENVWKISWKVVLFTKLSCLYERSCCDEAFPTAVTSWSRTKTHAHNAKHCSRITMAPMSLARACTRLYYGYKLWTETYGVCA